MSMQNPGTEIQSVPDLKINLCTNQIQVVGFGLVLHEETIIMER